MARKYICVAIAGLLGLIGLVETGCVGITYGPNLGPLGIPVPIPAYFQKLKEDDYWNNERYDRVPVLGPLTAGGPATALDPPSDDEVMRAMEKANPIQGGIPLLHEIQRNNVRIVKCKIADYIDPVRVVPLIGPVQLHHAHYKCTVYYSQNIWVGYPIPHKLVNEDAQEVLYIDHNHFHMVGDVDTGCDANF